MIYDAATIYVREEQQQNNLYNIILYIITFILHNKLIKHTTMKIKIITEKEEKYVIITLASHILEHINIAHYR